MITAIRKCILPFAIALFSVPPAFAAPSFVCGANPAQNTKLVQDAINKAGPIATITLPPVRIPCRLILSFLLVPKDCSTRPGSAESGAGLIRRSKNLLRA